MSKSSLSVWVFSVYSFTKAPSYFWVLSVDLRNVFCQLCPRFKTRWIIQFSFSIFAIIYHRDTRKHWQLPWLPDVTCQCLGSHPLLTISIFQNVRMIRFMHRNLGRLCVEISSCLSEAFMTKMWAMLWEDEEKGELSRKIIEKVTNDPSQIVQMTFYFYAERVLEKMTNKNQRKNVSVFKNEFLHFAFLHFNL